jgi:hypothetical protein
MTVVLAAGNGGNTPEVCILLCLGNISFGNKWLDVIPTTWRHAINPRLALRLIFMTRAPRIWFLMVDAERLWRGTLSSLCGLELVFGYPANSRCHFDKNTDLPL